MRHSRRGDTVVAVGGSNKMKYNLQFRSFNCDNSIEQTRNIF